MLDNFTQHQNVTMRLQAAGRLKNRNDSSSVGLSGSRGGPAGRSVTPEAIGELLVATGEIYGVDTPPDQELVLRNEYLATENRILRAKLNAASDLECGTDDARRNWPSTGP
jgi:hypothetical protein